MNKELEDDKIIKLIFKFSIPAVIGMVVNSIYNMVDRMFIGNFVGEDALAGLVIAFPIMMFYFAFAAVIGIGGSALISIKFGQKQYCYAQKVYGNMISLTMIVTVVGTLLGLLFLDNMLIIAGAHGEVFNEAKQYLGIIISGIGFQMFSFVLSSLLRTEVKPKLAMISMIFAALTNIALDYLFILEFNMGTFGAGLATLIGQAVGFIIPLVYFASGKSILKLKKENLKIKADIISQIFSIGSFNFINTVGISASAAVLNLALYKYGGDEAITAMGAINSLYTLFIMPVMGIQQGLQPIIGYNHGANQHKRVKETLFKGIMVSSIFSTIIFIILQLFPKVAVSLFIPSDSNTLPIAIEGLRYFIMMLPILSISIIGISFFQSTGRGKIALFLGSTRQFIFFIPLTYIVPLFFDNLTGVWLVAPIADLMSVLLALVFIYNTLKKY